jgi:hypothetical protein
MAIYYLKNFIKNSNNYQNYKMIAISYRIEPEIETNKIVTKINNIISNSISILPTNYYTIINEGGENKLYSLNISDIYTNILSIAPNNICKILDSNFNYIWYINFATIDNLGFVNFTSSSSNGGIININGINLSIDINTNSITDLTLPKLKNVTLWGANNTNYCSDMLSKTIIGDIQPSYTS